MSNIGTNRDPAVNASEGRKDAGSVASEPAELAVKVMLAAAGIIPTERERRRVAEIYAMFRPGVEAMYALEEVRYESPALAFQAAPKLGVWGSDG